jgi:thiol-disulfide isomerase/thioredoxin
MKLKICLVGLLCLFFQVSAQKISRTAGLVVGDTVPDLVLNNAINSPSGTIKLADYKNKLIILDFWATWCETCVYHLPETYSIQRDLKDEVKVILVNCKVTRNSKLEVENFLEKRKEAYQFPCLVQDTILNKMFPHVYIPHYVLIRNSKVVAITGSENINLANIKRILSDVNYNTDIKNDSLYVNNKPLFSSGNGGVEPLATYHSTVTGYLKNVRTTLGDIRNDSNLVIRIFAINQPIVELISYVSPKFYNYDESHKINLLTDKSLLSKELIVPGEKVSSSLLTYEGSFPPVDNNHALQYMKNDLSKYVRFRVDSEYRDTLCYVLKLGDPKRLNLGVKGALGESNFGENDGLPKYLLNHSADDLQHNLQSIYKRPFFNETCIKEPIKLTLPSNLLDVENLTRSLKNQGIILTGEKRRVSYMVIRDGE